MAHVGSMSLILFLMVASSLCFSSVKRYDNYGSRSKSYTSPYSRAYGSEYNTSDRSGYGSRYKTSSKSGSGSEYKTSNRYGYASRYKNGSGYKTSNRNGSGSRYKTSYRSISKAPLCKANGKILLKLFVKDDGKPVSKAKVTYVDNKILDTVSTDLSGYTAIPVYGCTVALMVYHKNNNPIYKAVDLLSCTSREERVVIKLDDKCNFNLIFSFKGSGFNVLNVCEFCGTEQQMVTFTYQSDDHTGYEQAVVGTPACISAGDEGDELIVHIKSQYANIYNVLNITITDKRYAVVSLPLQLVDDKKKFDIFFTSNTFQDDYRVPTTINFWKLYPNAGSNVITSFFSDGTFYDVISFGVEAGQLKYDEWLLSVQFQISGDDPYNDAVDFQGNVVVIDCDGNYQSVEHPDSGGADYKLGRWFLVGCFCNNAPSVKAGDFISIGKYVNGNGLRPYNKHCKDICM